MGLDQSTDRGIYVRWARREIELDDGFRVREQQRMLRLDL
jgi:hypothetical protein